MFRLLKLMQTMKMDSVSVEEPSCSLHKDKLKLFCLEDKQSVCLVCRDSQKHVNHTFRPISEAVSSYKVTQMSLVSYKKNSKSENVF